MDVPPTRQAVLAISSNKGGVGKTTVATNLAVYLRALHEDLGVLLVGLDDQSIIDRMFRLSPALPGELNLKHGWAQRNLASVLQLGQYGIHFVPTPPDTGPLKARASDPSTLRHILDRTGFQGLTILDTKSDLEALTENALAAANLVILPVSDWASFEEAEKTFALLRRQPAGERRGRVLFTLVDRRTRVDAQGHDLYDRLAKAADGEGWSRFQGFLSRSPRVEALNSGTGTPGSILHHAKGTAVHRQMRELAEEVTKLLALGNPGPIKPPLERTTGNTAGLGAGLKRALLKGLGSR